MAARDELSAADRAQLERAGISPAEAGRQLEQLRTPPRPIRLSRPCTVGDGIVRLDTGRLAALVARGEEARDAGRISKFVPASGAATRMFRALLAVRARGFATPLALAKAAADGDPDAAEAAKFIEELPRLALARPLAAALGVSVAELAREASRAPLAPLLATLLDPDGLGAATAPKALLPFHLDDGRPVTAFEEQLVEGIPYLVDRARLARFHFTVPPAGQERFEELLAPARERLADRARLEIRFSEQSRASDTLALDPDRRLARTTDGALLLRPSGHGALIGNLGAAGGDLVVIKNIDNVLPRRVHPEVARWKLALAGLAAELSAERGRDRPLRVCGVVPATGEPGGGPFWVVGSAGSAGADRSEGAEGAESRESTQIVEASQVAPAERDVWKRSTHFNPVDLVAVLRDDAGRPFDLERFVDPATSFVTRKSEGGRELVVLERPGLWNGAMAGWESVFVEVPGATFAPVKTVLDLARPEHAAPAD